MAGHKEGVYLVYPKNDMQRVMDFLDNLNYKGVAMARQVSLMGTILESGKPLEIFMEGGHGHENIEQDAPKSSRNE